METLECFGFIITWYIVIRILIISWLWPLLKYVWIIYLQNYNDHNRKYFQPSSDKWAIITGGTDGIGLAYCHQLAEIGYPLFIISRSLKKLESIAQQLREQYPQCPEIRIFQFDFNDNFESNNYDNLEMAIEQLSNIDILVNNVGISYRTAEFFTDITRIEPNFHRSIINVNIVSVLRLTLICLPRMIEQQNGIIINISSLSAICPMPLLSAYSASKACVDYFSQCLCLELNDQYPKIFIQSILPGFVATKMSKMSPSRTVPSADSYVHSAILSIGHTNRTFVFILHCLHYKLYQFSNHCFIDIYRRIAYKQMLKLRQKYLRKEALAKCKRIQ
ncbi:hypothetical protein DERF_004495 [Dermatophagoides farinae]|uniref:Uncharacterized protein n=1 Tax=Dermatophagoides farinae TaxID=6954 RepID=A0A922I7G2_DERFA|nr:very-long-chain 3-oxoacyl-CoA reductase-like [Dermatophagoides farinae]KAH9520803.1 hypothetical protein DERF_004495 [Dermatophagoides farinae]